MLNTSALKISLWLGSMLLNTFSEWKCWAYYINALSYSESNNRVLVARKWVHKTCPLRVEIACFFVYFGLREPFSFLVTLSVFIGGSFYLVYFVITELMARYGLGG